MDPARFDGLVRSLARPASRRRALGLLTGALATLAPAAAAATPAPARCLAVGKRCVQHESAASSHHRRGHGKRHGQDHGQGRGKLLSCAHCCSRNATTIAAGKGHCACKREGAACANPSQCCGGLCRDGTCTGCPGALVACDDGCIDLQTDPQHCGSCDGACGTGQRCHDGSCVCDGTSCPDGCCDGQTCKRGTSDQACGDGGADCVACRGADTCGGGDPGEPGVCGCTPRCGGKQCGDSGCGDSCGSCDGGKVCQQGACGCPNGANDCGGVCQQCCSPTDCPKAPCSEATCTNGTCGLDPIAGCCQSKSDCDDQNPCTIDDCVGNVCQHNSATPGASCGADQVCCGVTCCGSGQTCQSGSCAAPCTPTTCAALGRTCGSAQDGCGGTLDCGDCPFGKFCSSGQCAGCSQDSECPSSDPCTQGRCVIDARFRGHCQFNKIPGCCTANGDCSLNPCDVSVSCVSGQCMHTSACFGCMSCGADGGCSVSTCPECQYCGPGGVCKADTDQNGRACIREGVCWNGQCGCIPNEERCGGDDGVSGCCSGVCKAVFEGNFCISRGI